MGVYVVADAQFFDEAAAEKNNKTVDEYNEMIVQNWNSVINEDDWVLLMGIISNGTKEDNIKLFNNLNGKKKYITYDKDNDVISLEEYKEYGFVSTNNVPGFTKGIINGEDSTVIITGIRNYLFFKKYYNEEFNKYYFAMPGSFKLKNIYSNKILNISIENWGYSPIIYREIPQMIDNMILFESMKNEEENLNEKE